jgi:hypothetical protein
VNVIIAFVTANVASGLVFVKFLPRRPPAHSAELRMFGDRDFASLLPRERVVEGLPGQIGELQRVGGIVEQQFPANASGVRRSFQEAFAGNRRISSVRMERAEA